MATGAPQARHLRWVGPGQGFVSLDEQPAPALRQPAEPLLVADSWLVEDGRVRALSAHAARFSGACAQARSVPPRQTADFLREALPQLPATGRWFPRLELAGSEGDACLQLWIRPAPTRSDAVRLWLPPEPDRRSRPAIKGPDLTYLAGLRAAAQTAGADEAVLLSPEGRVREGGTTSILWWRDETLYAPPEGPDILPGVTRGQLLRIARESGLRVGFESPVPADLDGLEVWAVNALHGIRPVTEWAGADVTAGPARRAARWHARLEQLAAPLS